MAMARCPLCGRDVAIVSHHGRRVFDQHRTAPGVAETCDASGWVVEANERISQPRKRRDRSELVTDAALAEWDQLMKRAERVKARKAAEAAKEARDRWRG